MLREVTSQYLISSSLCHDSQECLVICWKDSLNSEAVVLTAMIYYGERMPNRTSKGKNTVAERGGIQAQDGKSSFSGDATQNVLLPPAAKYRNMYAVFLPRKAC